MTKTLSLCLVGLLLLAPGCTHLRKGFGNEQGKLDEKKISQRVAFIAGIALNLEAVKPYRTQVCNAIKMSAKVLRELKDKEVSEDKIRQVLQESLNRWLPDGNVKNVAVLVVNFIVDRTFDLVWDQYENLLQNDPLVIVRGIAFGLEQGCGEGVSLFEADEEIDTTELEKQLEKLLD